MALRVLVISLMLSVAAFAAAPASTSVTFHKDVERIMPGAETAPYLADQMLHV